MAEDQTDGLYDQVKAQGLRVKRQAAHKAVTLPHRSAAHKALVLEADVLATTLEEDALDTPQREEG